MILYFHLPPTRNDSDDDAAKNSDGTRRQRQTAMAAKV
jgi:hypothetical protein